MLLVVLYARTTENKGIIALKPLAYSIVHIFSGALSFYRIIGTLVYCILVVRIHFPSAFVSFFHLISD